MLLYMYMIMMCVYMHMYSRAENNSWTLVMDTGFVHRLGTTLVNNSWRLARDTG